MYKSSGIAPNYALSLNPNMIGNVSSMIPISLCPATNQNLNSTLSLIGPSNPNITTVNTNVQTNLINSNPNLSTEGYPPNMFAVSGFDLTNSQLPNPNLYCSFNNINPTHYYYDPNYVAAAAAAITAGTCLPQSNATNQTVLINSNNLPQIISPNDLTNPSLTSIYSNLGSHNIQTIPTAPINPQSSHVSTIPNLETSQNSFINLLNHNVNMNSILNCSLQTNHSLVPPNTVF